MNATLTEETRDGVCIITLRRPQVLNALNHQARTELTGALKAIPEREDIRVVVLEGEGRSFCAGQDQKESSQFDAATADRRIDTYGDLFDALRRVGRPTIAKTRGHAVGAGLQVALLADLRIADTSARIGLTELKVGSAAITGSWIMWPIAGEATVKRLVLTGEMVDAAEALRLGLVHEVVAPDELDARVANLASELASRAPFAASLTKEWWRLITEEQFRRAIAHAHEAHARNFESGGLLAGARAFVSRKS